jgi:hypothetical protein
MFIYCRYKAIGNLFGVLLETAHIRKVLVCYEELNEIWISYKTLFRLIYRL